MSCPSWAEAPGADCRAAMKIETHQWNCTSCHTDYHYQAPRGIPLPGVILAALAGVLVGYVWRLLQDG